jgi:hypothetical protein
MCSRNALSAVFSFFVVTMSGQSQSRPPEIPSHFKAMVPNENLSSAKTVTVTVTSRRPVNPDTPEDMEHLRKRVLNVLPKIPFTAVSSQTADLSLELVVEPNVRYGMFHYQNAPYVYLTLRKPSNGHLVYCAYQRASHFYSASDRLLKDLERTIHQHGVPSSDSLAPCSEQAMRPL